MCVKVVFKGLKMPKIQGATNALLNVIWIYTTFHFKAKDMSHLYVKTQNSPRVDPTSGLY